MCFSLLFLNPNPVSPPHLMFNSEQKRRSITNRRWMILTKSYSWKANGNVMIHEAEYSRHHLDCATSVVMEIWNAPLLLNLWQERLCLSWSKEWLCLQGQKEWKKDATRWGFWKFFCKTTKLISFPCIETHVYQQEQKQNTNKMKPKVPVFLKSIDLPGCLVLGLECWSDVMTPKNNASNAGNWEHRDK